MKSDVENICGKALGFCLKVKKIRWFWTKVMKSMAICRSFVKYHNDFCLSNKKAAKTK